MSENLTSTPIELLRKLSVKTNSQFSQEYGSAVMRWNKSYGSGISRAFTIVEGISVIIHDVIFNEDFHLVKEDIDSTSICFLYCFNGHIFHRFQSEDSYERIEKRQNVIIQSSKESNNIILFPKHTKIRVSNIIIVKDVLAQQKSLRAKFITEGLQDVLDFVATRAPFRYFGPINSNIVQYSKILFVSKKIDFVSRLILEGSSLNVLANQINSYNINELDAYDCLSLSDNDLNRILELTEYIGNNLDQPLTIPGLTKIAGMNPNKIQKGFKYFFDETINEFVRNARMSRAKELIELTKLTFSEISYSIGINSRSYFSKEFTKAYGSTPKDYRKSLEKIKPHFELTYHSTANPELSDQDILNILAEAREFNAKHNISGCLLYHDGSFFQILEGTKQSILELISRIEIDERHSQVDLIWKGYKGLRSFKDWSMGYIDRESLSNLKGNKELRNFNFLGILEKEKKNLVDKKMFWQQVKNRLVVSMKSA